MTAPLITSSVQKPLLSKSKKFISIFENQLTHRFDLCRFFHLKIASIQQELLYKQITERGLASKVININCCGKGDVSHISYVILRSVQSSCKYSQWNARFEPDLDRVEEIEESLVKKAYTQMGRWIDLLRPCYLGVLCIGFLQEQGITTSTVHVISQFYFLQKSKMIIKMIGKSES